MKGPKKVFAKKHRKLIRLTQIVKSLGLWKTLLAGSVFVLIGLCVGVYVIQKPKPNNQVTPSYTYNDQIKEDSETVWSEESELYSYVKKFGTYKTIKHLDALSSRLGNCHEKAHKAGRYAYEIYNEGAFKDGSQECHSGIYHGAQEAFFRDKGTGNLNENVKTICAYSGNNFFNFQCVHGVGHGLMAWASYELPEALKICDTLQQNASACYSGVFMENIVGGLASEARPEDQKELAGHFTRYLNNDPHYPCNEVEEQYKNMCYFLQTSRMLQIFGEDFARIAQACMDAPEAHRNSCFSSMGRDVSGRNHHNLQGIVKGCGAVTNKLYHTICMQGATQDLFWDPQGSDEAIEFCNMLTGQLKAGCFNTIINRAKEILIGKTSQEEFCSKFDLSFISQCKMILLDAKVENGLPQ